MATLEEIEERLRRVENRLRVLEDIEEIKSLKAHYAAICDSGYNPDEVIKIFTEDAVWDGGEEFGVHRGRREIYEFFKRASEEIIFAVHYFTNPQIKVEGDGASARWYLLMAGTLRGEGAIWLAGYEDDKYRKVDGRWLLEEMKLTLLFKAPYEKGWHKTR